MLGQNVILPKAYPRVQYCGGIWALAFGPGNASWERGRMLIVAFPIIAREIISDNWAT
jgi:hypothetical protein